MRLRKRHIANVHIEEALEVPRELQGPFHRISPSPT